MAGGRVGPTRLPSVRLAGATLPAGAPSSPGRCADGTARPALGVTGDTRRPLAPPP